jgi:hypothetical protein
LFDGPFVTSFSAEPESLYQWRSYCPIANGVAIGFRTECLKAAELIWKPVTEGDARTVFDAIPPCEFKAVSYVTPNQEGLALNVLHSAYTAALRTDKVFGNEYGSNSNIEGYFQYNIEAEASFYKHKGFTSESEYRLVLPSTYQQAHQIQFRCTRSSMAPYVELSVPRSSTAEMIRQDVFKWDAVSAIVIGPTPNVELTRRAVWNFCRSIGLMSADITTSKLPYRDW